MSWNSVVKRGSAASEDRTDDRSADAPVPAENPPPPPASATAFAASAPIAPVTQPESALSFTTPSVTTSAPTAPPSASPPVAPIPATPEPVAPPAPPAPAAPEPAAPAPAPVAPAPVAPAPVAPAPVADAPALDSASAGVPTTTLDPETAPAQPTAVAAPAPVEPAPVVASTPVVPAPTQPNQSLSLPPSAAVRQAAESVVAEKPAKVRKPRKDRSGSIAKVAFFFLVVGALASAAVIFGRPYLFPADWESNALEFAEPIENSRGVDFVEPVLLTPQASAVHREMVATQLLGDPASNLPMWRALGLAGPDSTDDETLRSLISEQSPVLYSTVDGQVYYDSSFTRSDRAALISRAMATAALDQELAFSADAPNRTLDDAALTEANVRQQAAIIAENATSRAPLPSTDMAALAFLPSVLDYSLTAPAVFVELLPSFNDVDANPLAGLGLQGPGPLRVPPLAQIPSNSATIGDTVVGSSVITDRSFWYMSFASHLEADTAYRMSNELQGAGLQMVDGSAGRCAVATLTTGDPATDANLQADLDQWVAATAPELGATVTALADSSVQLRSCDPSGVYTSNIRFGVARQLIAWRAIELAVTNVVTAQGGTEADVTAAIASIGSSPSASAVVQLPAGTAPTELAAAAQAAATDVVVAGAALPDDGAAAVEAAAAEE